ILISEAPNNTIGGLVAGARNVISGNGSNGIALTNSNAGPATGNLIQGNFIGTDVTGTKPLGNFPFDAGTGQGIVLGGTGNTVGGNLVEGNFIGPDATGSGTLGNQGDGVRTGDFSPSNNTIGGTVAGSGNVIRGNSANGVVIVCCATGDAILGNSVSGNGQIGIDLSLPGTLNGDGVTPNDPGDADTGGNDLQNFPVLSAA